MVGRDGGNTVIKDRMMKEQRNYINRKGLGKGGLVEMTRDWEYILCLAMLRQYGTVRTGGNW